MINGFREVDPGRIGNAVGTGAQIDVVEVLVEDLVLAQLALELESQRCLLGLTHQGAVLGQKDDPGQLLGDGARSLLHLAAGNIGDQGAADADDVDAVVLIEAGVFRCDEGVLDQLRHLAQGDLLARGRPQLLQHITVGREDRHRSRPAERTDAACIGQ